ncbi:hypothetical protein EV641_116114 [Rhodococcus sp. SMB37]|uniref:hypothetical protein n=1 Tax=Rhodococcus sp. SMB37 TaxID=2512213 RepID=UPI0010489D9F|nr:hypothetical protein [Rhodococcus sp. SMB37]TCN49265.1 hypothetical protein EV641_116114 [Rhodococcus sp. SMB37]
MSDGRLRDSRLFDIEAAYRRIRLVLGDFAHTVDLAGFDEFPGSLLTDPEWLAERVADTGVRWGCDDARVNGTLWWYSASSTLVAGSVAMLLTEGSAPDPDPDRLRCALRENGYLAAVRSSRIVHGAEVYAEALAAAHTSVISALATVSGASPRALWAIATDSVAGRALTVGRQLDRVEGACELSESLAVAPMLTPRFVDVDSGGRSERFVRRGSCCLIYVATGENKCMSCPRHAPADRLSKLRQRAAQTA